MEIKLYELGIGILAIFCSRGLVYLIEFIYPPIIERVLFGYSMALFSIIFYQMIESILKMLEDG